NPTICREGVLQTGRGAHFTCCPPGGSRRRVGRSGQAATGMPPFSAGCWVTHHDLAVGLLRHQGISDKLSIVGKLRSLNRTPAVVVAVTQRTFGGNRLRPYRRSQQQHEDAASQPGEESKTKCLQVPSLNDHGCSLVSRDA